MFTLSKHLMKSAAALCAAVALSACGPSEPPIQGGTPDMRRLTQEQYANIVADVFGEHLIVGGTFDPLVRTDGLLALGARSARITPAGFEKYYDLSRSIAAQVVNTENREDLISCQPASPTAADDACATTFFTQVGRLLYRRPLTEEELATAVTAARDGANTNADFYAGIGEALAGLMATPQFLFVIDTTEADPDNAGKERLTAHAKAARLSFLLWNTTPDDVLLAAAEKGELHTADGLARQADRMLSSPKLERGVDGFFADFFDFEKFETMEKDPVIYPAFSLRVAEDAREQLLRTINNHLINQQGDYRDLFTTRKTFISPALARIYQVPAGRPDGGWAPYEFPAGSPRAGIVTQIGFIALHSHPGRSSPTIRGKAIREMLLCQRVPDPPGDVDFTLFNDPTSPSKTARQRLSAHATVAACAGCHKITDPIGLGLEHFDGVGEIRSVENGEPIDVTGDLDGVTYKDAVGLAQAIRDNPAAPSCVVNRLSAYAMGRSLSRDDGAFVSYLEETFAGEGYNFPQLLRAIATSEALYTVSAPAKTTASTANDPAKENKS